MGSAPAGPAPEPAPIRLRALDGATTAPRDLDTGCQHGVAWFTRTLAGLIARVRAAEAADADCARWPRLKPSDDATIVYWYQPVSAGDE